MSIVHSGLFSLSNQILQITISIGSLAILGRLLTPQDFGLYGIIIATEGLFSPIIDMGLTPAFIKLENADKEASNAFFSMNFILGLINTLCLILISPLLFLFYRKIELIPLMIIYSFSLLLKSSSVQPIAMLMRSKRFDKIMFANLLGFLSGTIMAITGAFCGLGVWALILRPYGYGLVRLLTAVKMLSHRYRLLGWRIIRGYRESIRFGAEIVVSRLVGGLLNSLDKLIFGKFYNINMLGHYTRAVQLVRMPDANIRTALTTPSLAHLARYDRNTQIIGYRLLLNFTMIIAGLPCIIFIVIGDWILPWLMGPQWNEGGIYLRLFGFWGIGKIMHGIITVFFINEFKTRAWIKINSVSIPLIIGVPLFLATLGFNAKSYISVLSIGNFIYWFVVLIFFFHSISNSFKTTFFVGWGIFLTSIVSTILGVIVKKYLSGFFLKLPQVGVTIHILTLSLLILFIVLSVHCCFNYRQIREIYFFIRSKFNLQIQKN